MTGALFAITFYLAAPFWLLMIFAPAWSGTARVVASPLTVLPVLAVYVVLAVPVFPELWTAVSSPDIDTFRDLTALAAWSGRHLGAGDRLGSAAGTVDVSPEPEAGALAVADGAAAGPDDPAVAVRAADLPRRPGRPAAAARDARRLRVAPPPVARSGKIARIRPIRTAVGSESLPEPTIAPGGTRVKEAVHISGVPSPGPDLQELLVRVARGDQDAFAAVYDAVSGPVLGLVRSVLRDPAQSEEVAQEVLVEVWRTAPRFQASRGSAMNWVLTLAHHRAVDRVRSAESAAAREHKAALLDRTPAFDEVAEQVETRLEREQVRRCMRTLSELQRESVTLAYYRGLTYREVSELLAVPLGTIKTRLRDGLIRLRDCLGVSA